MCLEQQDDAIKWIVEKSEEEIAISSLGILWGVKIFKSRANTYMYNKCFRDLYFVLKL